MKRILHAILYVYVVVSAPLLWMMYGAPCLHSSPDDHDVEYVFDPVGEHAWFATLPKAVELVRSIDHAAHIRIVVPYNRHSEYCEFDIVEPARCVRVRIVNVSTTYEYEPVMRLSQLR